MRKFSLDINALEVETFSAGRPERGVGTVRAHDTTGYQYPDDSELAGCYEYMPTDERDSCEMCTQWNSVCQRPSNAPTWCPKSMCTGSGDPLAGCVAEG